MSASNNFSELFKEYILRKIPSAKLASGGSVLNCRCIECGDSADPHSRHMYIFPPGRKKKPLWYYCHKCNATGLFDHKKMIQWSIYEAEMAQMVNDYNHSVLKKGRYDGYNPNIRYFLINDYITLDDLTGIKMNYINNRLGTHLSPQDFLNLKIVLNLKDLIQRNQMRLTRNENIVNDLDRAFVGFLSIDNAFVCLRKIGEDKVYHGIDQRYVDYRVSFKEDTSQKFYTIPTRINLLATNQNRIPIHIAEGAFDILSIYFNLRNKEEGVYTSVTGSNYIQIIYHFLMMIKSPNIEIHIYPDNDNGGAQWKMRKIRDWINEMFPLYIHRNYAPREKDFGVSIDRIDEKITAFNHTAQMELFNKIR